MQSRRHGEYAAASVIAALALAISPLGIELATGRVDLSFRVASASVALVVFLLTISGAILAQARCRRVFFVLIAWTFPLAALACLEMAAIALHLADRVAPLEDTSILAHAGDWPGYLLSDGRWMPGMRLYRPWQGPGISINALGLRTSPPSPKVAGERRIAVTGGSAVWGWRVLDADTIPAQLQQLTHAGDPNLTFYSFGIEGATLAQELAVLRQFRDIYGIDQVIFYTGANDALSAYLGMSGAQNIRLFDASTGLTSFELVKAATRLVRTASEPSTAMLARLEREMLPMLERDNRFGAALAAAKDYCDATGLRCDFLLQPLLFTRASPIGPEQHLATTFRRLFPGLAPLAVQMYRDARVSLPVQDLSDMFDGIAAPVFTDNVHVNELGNRIVAERIRATIPFDSP
jgi:lysophospholipase L1-like esterase